MIISASVFLSVSWSLCMCVIYDPLLLTNSSFSSVSMLLCSLHTCFYQVGGGSRWPSQTRCWRECARWPAMSLTRWCSAGWVKKTPSEPARWSWSRDCRDSWFWPLTDSSIKVQKTDIKSVIISAHEHYHPMWATINHFNAIYMVLKVYAFYHGTVLFC